jgi:CRISPR-associated endoribonuclease Cas6
VRIKLTLTPKDRSCAIPINYQYPLSAAIYKILNSASPDYAAFLHEKGYISPNRKPLKLFTFSRLWCPDMKRAGSTLVIRSQTSCHFQIASPMLEDFVQNFVIGLFQQQEIDIGGPQTVGKFAITQVETLAAPEFSPEEKFISLAPIVASAKHEHRGKETTYYIRPGDPQLGDAIRKNLVQKFQTIYKKIPDDEQLTFSLDENYIQRKGGYDKISKLITIKEGEEQETQIKCFIAPFALKGSTELMRVAYECGIGEKNSLGFGMIEVVE